MAMSKNDRRDEIDRLVKSALEDLETVLLTFTEEPIELDSRDRRSFERARDDLARAKALIEAGA